MTEQIPTPVPTPEIQVENPSVVAEKEVEKIEKETTKQRRGRKTRFDKDKNAEKVETPLVVTEEVQTAGTVLKAGEEIKPEISEELIEEKLKQAEPKEEAKEPVEEKPSKTSKGKKEEVKTDEISATEEKTEAEPPTEEVAEEKPKRTRRPNRGASKRTRTRKTVKEEKVEEE